MRDKEQKEQKEQKKQKKWSIDRVLSLLSVAFASIPALQIIKNYKIPQIGFNVVVFILILIVVSMISVLVYIFFKEWKAYKNNLEQLSEWAELNQNALEGFGYWAYEFKKEYHEKLRKNMRGVQLVFIALTVIIATCICYPQNAYAFWSSMIGIGAEENEKEDIIEVGENESEEIVLEERDMQWRFVLDKSADSFALGTQMQNQVFFYSDKEFTEWVDYVQETAEHWKGTREGVDYKTIKDKDGNSFFTYTDIEDTFKKEVEDASQYIYYEEWMQYAPDSSEYDECIAGREKLNKIEVEGETGCYEIWWKLANDYLYYAQEYEAQTTNADAVLYYYTNSIYCCMEALKYSVTEEEYNTTYHFMVMRYHDICRNECIIPQEYKMTASNIYSILVETDTLNGR